jgi:hypothetical protein
VNTREFEEIGHTGGTVTFHVVTGADGRRGYQVGYQHSRPVAVSMFGLYALPQGVVAAPLPMGGIGDKWPQPPVPGCFPVFIASDSANGALNFYIRVAPAAVRDILFRGTFGNDRTVVNIGISEIELAEQIPSVSEKKIGFWVTQATFL